MVPSLRKKHRLIWIILAIVLPLLFVMSVWVIPQPVYQEELPQPTAEPDPEVPSIDEPTQR